MCTAPCSCATGMKRMPAAGKMSSASMYAEPTMPKMSVTPCATIVSTKASEGVIFTLPETTVRSPRAMSFMGAPCEKRMEKNRISEEYMSPRPPSLDPSQTPRTMEEEKKVQIHRGLNGVYFDRSRVCDIDGKAGELRYRGYSIHDLAERSTFEETCYLLLRGELPSRAELEGFSAELRAARSLPAGIHELIRIVK